MSQSIIYMVLLPPLIIVAVKISSVQNIGNCGHLPLFGRILK